MMHATKEGISYMTPFVSMERDRLNIGQRLTTFSVTCPLPLPPPPPPHPEGNGAIVAAFGVQLEPDQPWMESSAPARVPRRGELCSFTLFGLRCQQGRTSERSFFSAHTDMHLGSSRLARRPARRQCRTEASHRLCDVAMWRVCLRSRSTSLQENLRAEAKKGCAHPYAEEERMG